jgi:putative hydrolase of the HAD superfamily
VIKAIIFDFFGVIGRSTHAMMREHFNLTPEQMLEIKNLHKMLDYEFIGSRNYLSAFAKIVGSTYDEVYKVYEDSRNRFSSSNQILGYITELRKTCKVALLTNVTKQAFDEFISPVEDYFDLIVTSYDTKWAKPEAAIYELCAQRLGLDVSECLMVDDSYTNCEGARAAGMEAIHFKDFDQFKTELEAILSDSDD